MVTQSNKPTVVETMSDGQTLKVGEIIGSGGEQTVYSTKNAPGIALAIPNQMTVEHEDRLRFLLVWTVAISVLKCFAWPLDLVTDSSGKVVGYTMKRVEGELLSTYLSPMTRPQSTTLLFMLRVFKNFAEAIHAAQASGFRIGDLNCNNVLVQADGQVVVLDVPSFYVSYQQRVFSTASGVGEYLPPELLDAFDKGTLANQPRTIHGDSYSFGVLLFKGLFEFHPFANREMVDVETVVSSGEWPYDVNSNRYHPKSASPPLTALPPALIKLLTRCFVAGMNDPTLRPSISEWHIALDEWIADEEQVFKKSRQRTKNSSSTQNPIPRQSLATPLTLTAALLFAAWLLVVEPEQPSQQKETTNRDTPQLWLDLQAIQHSNQGEVR